MYMKLCFVPLFLVHISPQTDFFSGFATDLKSIPLGLVPETNTNMIFR